MRKLVIGAALLSTAIATPAFARDGSPYVGVDAGIMKPNTFDLRFVNSSTAVSDALRLRHKVGYDIDGVFGYDLGMVRVEGELGYKRARLKDATAEQAALAAVLLPNQPLHYTATGRGTFWSGMINALLDLGPSDGLNGSIGAGVGYVRARYRAGLIPSNTLNFTSSDAAIALQGLAELRMPVSQSIDLGLKYRYFRTERLKFGAFCVTTCPSTTPFHLSGRYVSNSVLASLR